MNSEGTNRPPFLERISSPEMLVALSAVLLSVCGLFISIYETSLIRQAQRASVWPHVQVGVSITQTGVKLRAENTGVGPARIQASAVTYKGETQADWSDLIRSVVGDEADSVGFTRSLINGRVLPSNSSETMFSVTTDSGAVEREVAALLGRAILEGDVDVTACYCSVYDECWTSSLQDVLDRARRVEKSNDLREVDGCDSAKRSGI